MPKSFNPQFEQQLAEAEPYARRVQVALAHGNHDAARFAIDEHENLVEKKLKPTGDRTKLTLAEAGFGMRTIGYLEIKRVETIADLLDLNWNEVSEIPGIGPVAEKEILEVLQKLGFEVKGKNHE